MTIFQGFARKRALTWSDTVCQTHPSPHILLTPRDFHVRTASLWLCMKLPIISIFGASLMKLWKHLAGICCWTVGVITEIRAEIWIWITSFIFICEFAYLYLCIFVFSFCICESAFVYLYFYIYVFAVGVIREIGAQSLNLDQDLIGHRSLRFSSVSDSSLYFWSFMVAELRDYTLY